MAEHANEAQGQAGIAAWFRHEFQRRNLIPNLISGSVTSVLTVIEAVSYATLIFSGVLARDISAGIAVALIAAAAGGLVMALLSSYPGTITVPQNKIAPVLALVAASLAAAMPPGATTEETLLTVVAAIILCTLATGLFLLGLGYFKLGRLIRFIPFPVIAGFLAGTGWLLLLGSVKAMTGTPVTLATLPSFFTGAVFVKWVPGLGFAVVAFILMRRIRHFLVMPALMLGAVALFYGALLAFHTSPTEARAAGWLVHTTAEGGLFRFLTFTSLAHANWSLIATQAASIATILFISAVAVLLNSSALELAAQQEMDLDQELKAAGAANLATGLAGGMVGFTSLTISGLALQMGVRSRLVGLMTATFAGLVLFLGAGVLAYFPEPIIGGLLMFLGFEFLHKWVFDTYKKLPRTEWVIVLIILAVVGLFGFLQGVLVGVVAAIILFVITYSGVDVVKNTLDGSHHHSNVDRSSRQMQLLHTSGGGIHIMHLQGFIFFGTANNLLNRIKGRFTDDVRPPVRFLVLDFRDVRGIDASSVVSLTKMRQLTEKQEIRVVFTHLSTILHEQLDRGRLFEDADPAIECFGDLDHGMEWCEDRLLEAEDHEEAGKQRTLAAYLEEMDPGRIDFEKLSAYLERREVATGAYVLEQGQPAQAIYFLESGTVTVTLELSDGQLLRLRKMSAGTVVGELGLYLGKRRTASVVANEPTVVYRLSSESLATMEEKNPQTAASFHQFMACVLAQRLLNTDKTVKALLD